MGRTVRLTLLALLVALLAATPAPAATVSFKSTVVQVAQNSSRTFSEARFIAEVGERNIVRVSLDGDRIVFREATAPLRAGNGCEAAAEGEVRCPHLVGTDVIVEAGDLDDEVSAEGLSANPPVLTAFDGGEGADRLIGADNGDHRLDGGPGDDLVEGRGGRDVLVGGPGRDRLDGGEGDDDQLTGDGEGAAPEADVLDGGPGTRDAVSYVERTAPVVVDLADRGPDGGLGENDVLRRIEDANGGAGADRPLGDAGNNRLDDCGGPEGRTCSADGNDRLDGRGGHDELSDTAGDDRLAGGAGADTLRGGDGDDAHAGGPGDDHLLDNNGRDRLDGGDGDDLVTVQWAPADPNRVVCAGGRDLVVFPMPRDVVPLDCERIDARGITIAVRKLYGRGRPGLRLAFKGDGPGLCAGAVRLQSVGSRGTRRTVDRRGFRLRPGECSTTTLRARAPRGRFAVRLDYRRCRGYRTTQANGFVLPLNALR